jgi:TonB family protein
VNHLRLIAVSLVSLLAAALARAELKLYCEIGGQKLPVTAVAHHAVVCRNGAEDITLDRDALWHTKWVVEGDLKANAATVCWSPLYTIRRKDVPDWQAAAIEHPAVATVSMVHMTRIQVHPVKSEFLRRWPTGVPDEAIVVLAWVVDGRIVRTGGHVVPSTKREYFNARDLFELTTSEARGQAVALLWVGGRFVAPIARFADPAEQQAFIAAVCRDRSALLEALHHGVSASARDRDKIPLLQYAAEAGATEPVDELIKAGARVNAHADFIYDNPLLAAIDTGRTDIVRLLLTAGASIDNEYIVQGSALQRAIDGRYNEIALMLCELNPNLKLDRDPFAVASVSRAITEGMTDVVERLLQEQSVDFAHEQWRRVLITQAQHGHAGIVKLLLDHHVAADHAENGTSALVTGATSGDPEIARMLLAAGAQADRRDANGYTPLMGAMLGDNAEYARVLLAAGADPNARTSAGLTALHLAASANAAKAVGVLIAKGADISAQTKAKLTALDLALTSNAKDAAAALAAAGSRVDVHGRLAAADLAMVVMYDLSPVLKAALTDGWPVDKPLVDQWTLLRLADAYNAAECAALLRAAGARPEPSLPNAATRRDVQRVPQLESSVPPEDPRDVDLDFPACEVVVDALVDSDGSVQFAKVVSAPVPAIVGSALTALYQWRFTPAVAGGKAVPMRVRIPIEFPSSQYRLLADFDVDVPPVALPLSHLDWEYPRESSPTNNHATIELRVTIGVDGHVSDPRVISSSNPLFNDAAMATVVKMKFTPGQLDGKPVQVRGRFDIAY